MKLFIIYYIVLNIKLKLIEKISNTDYTKWYNKEGVFYYNIDEEFTLYIKFLDKDYRIGVYSKIIKIEFAIYDEKEIEFIQEFTSLLAITNHKNTSISMDLFILISTGSLVEVDYITQQEYAINDKIYYAGVWSNEINEYVNNLDIETAEDSSCIVSKEGLFFSSSNGLRKYSLNEDKRESLFVSRADSEVFGLDTDKFIPAFSLFSTFMSTAMCLKELLHEKPYVNMVFAGVYSIE
jgi:hypothetical protein